VPESNRFGSVERDESLRVTMLPSHRAEKGAPCNGGLYLINPDVLLKKIPVLKQFSFEDYWLPDLLSRDVKIYGFEVPGTFIDIGLPHDYNFINKNQNIYFNKTI
jgi:D-glycero-alpha-D-manno-heptose 1-phosphate guanylyltransferase